jgi:hypothetical protein
MGKRPGCKGAGLRRTVVLTVLAASAVLAQTATAAGANTFEGTCAFSGVLRFEPPLGNQLGETSFRDYAAGRCTGTLNGVPQVDAPVLIRGRGSGTLSCLAGRATNFAKLIFTRGTRTDSDDARIRFVAETAGGLLEFAAVFRGAVSGRGIAHVNFLPYADESSRAACESGTLGSARYDLSARTVTPVVG